MIFVVFLLTIGCGGNPASPPTEQDYFKLDVPYVEQATPVWCLPASATMVLNYYGENVSQYEVANNIVGNYGWGEEELLMEYLPKIGFKLDIKELTIDGIKDVLKENKPILTLQHYSLTDSDFHYRVIIGFDDKKEEIVTNDPMIGEDYKISYSDFVNLNQQNSLKCISFIILPVEN